MRYPTPALWRCRPVSVHDGDTLTVDVDRGYEDTSRLSIRLKDTWAPELADDGGRDCRDFVLGWLTDHTDGTPWPFLLETFRTVRSDVEVKTFDRFVGVVSSTAGLSLNEAVTAFVRERGYGTGVT